MIRTKLYWIIFNNVTKKYPAHNSVLSTTSPIIYTRKQVGELNGLDRKGGLSNA